MSVTNLEEFLQKLQNNEIGTVSELKLRDENIQVKNRIKSIPRIKRDIKKKSKLLIQTELAIPFNPWTCEPDAQFNADNKFRPLMAQTTLMLVLKKFCNEHADVKAKYMKKAGVEQWDTSNSEAITATDRLVFRRYRVARKFTLPVVHINIPILTKSDFGRDYLIEVKRDPNTGNIEGEWPAPLSANKLYNDIAYEEIEKIREENEKSPTPLNDQDLNEKIKKVYNKIPVSSDYPLNYMLAFEIPLEPDFSMKSGEITEEMTRDEIFGQMVLVKCTKEVLTAVENYENGAYNVIDVYDEFWEFDMKCPVDKGLDAKEIGKGTRYEKPMVAIEKHQYFKEWYEAVRDYLDNAQDLEKIFMRSARVTKFDDSVEAKFLDALKTVLDIKDNPWLTEKVITNNADFISLVFGEEGDELIALASMSDEPEGNLNTEEAQKLGKEINIGAILGDDEITTEEVNLEME